MIQVFGGSNEHKGSLAAIVDVNGDRGADFIFISGFYSLS